MLGLMSMCGITRTDADEARVSSPGIVDHSREDHPSPLVRPARSQAWSGTVYKNFRLAVSAEKTSV